MSTIKRARAEDYLRAIVDSAPPLTDEQLIGLAEILRPVAPEPTPARRTTPTRGTPTMSKGPRNRGRRQGVVYRDKDLEIFYVPLDDVAQYHILYRGCFIVVPAPFVTAVASAVGLIQVDAADQRAAGNRFFRDDPKGGATE